MNNYTNITDYREIFEETLDRLSQDVNGMAEYDDDASVVVICNKPEANHCDLTWYIYIDGKDVSDHIPDILKHSCMDTKNIYTNLSDDSEDIENYQEMEGGYDEEDWIHVNGYWLDTITTNTNVQKAIFKGIQSQEFTGCAECGGCI